MLWLQLGLELGELAKPTQLIFGRDICRAPVIIYIPTIFLKIW